MVRYGIINLGQFFYRIISYRNTPYNLIIDN